MPDGQLESLGLPQIMCPALCQPFSLSSFLNPCLSEEDSLPSTVFIEAVREERLWKNCVGEEILKQFLVMAIWSSGKRLDLAKGEQML